MTSFARKTAAIHGAEESEQMILVRKGIYTEKGSKR